MNAEQFLAMPSADYGYRTDLVVAGNDMSLHLSLKDHNGAPHIFGYLRDDVPATTKILRRCVCCEANDIADFRRMKLLSDAVCRFVNTGGELMDLLAVVEQISDMVVDVYDPTPVGLTLLSTELNDENVGEHLYQVDKDPHRGILWVEGEFVEEFSLVDYLNQQRQEEDDDDDDADTCDAGPAGERGRLEVQRQGRDETAADAAGSSTA